MSQRTRTRAPAFAFVVLGGAIGIVLFSMIAACSGEGDVGEECEESGKVSGECKSGGICGKNAGGALICLRVCNDQNQCTAAEDCNGVEGSNIKGCRPKK